MVTLHQLNTFKVSAERLNLSETAHALNVTPTAVSHAIKDLERRLEVKLIQKVRTGIELTEAGESFRADLITPLNDINAVIDKHSWKKTPQPAAIVSVGASHGPSSRLVPSLLTLFQRHFPQVHIVQHTGTSAEIETSLLKGAVDVAFVSNPSHRPGLTVEPFAKEQLRIVVATTHPHAKKGKIDAVQLAATPLLVGTGKDRRGTTTEVLQRQLGSKFNFTIGMEFDAPEALKAAVMSGAGVGILYQDMIREELKNGSLTILKPLGFELDGECHLAFVKDRQLAPIATQFLEFARTRKVSIGEESERAARINGLPRGRRNKDSGQPINLRESGLMGS